MANITSNGTGGGNWNAGATWIGGTKPGAADNATVVAGDTVTVAQDQACTNLTSQLASLFILSAGQTLDSSGTVSLDGSVSILGTLKTAGDLTLVAGMSMMGFAAGSLYGKPAMVYNDGAEIDDRTTALYLPFLVDVDSSFVVELDAYEDGSPSDGTMVAVLASPTPPGFVLTQAADKKLRLNVGITGDDKGEWLTDAAAINANAWNSIRVVFDGADPVFTVNGVVRAHSVVTPTLTTVDNFATHLPAHQGSVFAGGGPLDTFAGKLSMVALTAGTTPPADLYRNISPDEYSGYAAFWPHTEGTGSTLDDAAGDGTYDAIIRGTINWETQSAASGKIVFDGGAAQTLTTNETPLPDLEIDKSANGVTVDGGLFCGGLLVTAGSLDGDSNDVESLLDGRMTGLGTVANLTCTKRLVAWGATDGGGNSLQVEFAPRQIGTMAMAS